MYKQSLHLPRISDKYYFYISLTNNKQPCLVKLVYFSQAGIVVPTYKMFPSSFWHWDHRKNLYCFF